MIAWCIRYWTVSRRAICGPQRAISRSKRLVAKPSAAASRLTTVGGNWQWSPANTSRSHRRMGIQQPGSVLWQASSITARSNRRAPRSWLSRPVVVAHSTLAEPSMLSTACICIRRASASSPRASARSCCRRPGFGADPGPAVRLAEQRHGLLDELAGQQNVVVPLDEQVERIGAQVGQHAGRMAQPHDPLAEAQQPLENIVHAQVARGAGQHLLSPPHGLPDHLHHGGGLARARRPVDQPHVAGGKGELDGRALHGVEARVQRPQRRAKAEFRPPQAHKHVAQHRRAVAAGRAGLLQRRPLPLGRHLVERQVQPPGLVIGQLLGHPIQRHRDRPLVTLANHAAMRRAVLGRGGREDDRAAHAQPGPGQRSAAALAKLEQVPPAQARLLVDDQQFDQRVSRPLRVWADRRRACRRASSASARLSKSRQRAERWKWSSLEGLSAG